MQRGFDIIFSSIALVLLSPFFLLLMLILRVTGEGEIFFRQNRVGLGGKYFKLIKFATMLKDSPNIRTGTEPWGIYVSGKGKKISRRDPVKHPDN